jgi:hypothetical protein
MTAFAGRRNFIWIDWILVFRRDVCSERNRMTLRDVLCHVSLVSKSPRFAHRARGIGWHS